MRRQWPPPRPDHELVDVAVEIAVDRIRTAGSQRAADERPHREPGPVPELDAGYLARREDHRRDGRHEQELDDPRLCQGDIGTDRIGRLEGSRGARCLSVRILDRAAGFSGFNGPSRRPGGVVAHRHQTRHVRPDQRPEREVERLAPTGETGQDLYTTDDRLDREEQACRQREPENDGTLALRPPRRGRNDKDDEPDDDRDPAMEDVGARRIGHRREERAVHERPVAEDIPLRRGGDVGAEQEQGEDGGRPECRHESEALAAPAPADPGRVERPGKNEGEEPDEAHRGREMGGHGLAGVVQPDGLFAQPRLEADQHDDGERRPQQRGAVAVIAECDKRKAENEKAYHHGDRPVDPFEPGLVVAERRHDLAVTEWPIRAAHPGPGRPDDDADRDEQKRCHEAGGGEFLEAGHGPSRRSPAAGTECELRRPF